ncbi:enoyl-CoA hydratase/isomerase family protein [Pontiella desulfatans]|nr:enoyl-CoA hydratase/isomerase family protein [Pontiella desulfatans]
MNKTQVTYEVENGIGTLLLVPPEGKPLTLDGEVMVELEQAIAGLAAEAPRMVWVRSMSERFFCVGANLNVLQNTNEETIVPWVMQGHRVLNMLEDLSMPVVAVVEGYAMGGGLELAMACDLIFAADGAKLAQSEAGLGFIPGWGGTRRLAGRIGVAKAKYYYYSGAMIDAPKAAEIGLVDFVGSKEEIEAERGRFSTAVAANNSNSLTQFKTILNQQERAARDENAAVEAFRSISCLQDPDTKQRLHDFLTKKGKKV